MNHLEKIAALRLNNNVQKQHIAQHSDAMDEMRKIMKRNFAEIELLYYKDLFEKISSDLRAHLVVDSKEGCMQTFAISLKIVNVKTAEESLLPLTDPSHPLSALNSIAYFVLKQLEPTAEGKIKEHNEKYSKFPDSFNFYRTVKSLINNNSVPVLYSDAGSILLKAAYIQNLLETLIPEPINLREM